MSLTVARWTDLVAGFLKILGYNPLEDENIFQSRRVIVQWEDTLCFPYVVINFIQHVYLVRAILFHVLDKELVGSNSSLGQVHIQLKYLDLDEPITKRYPLADLVSSSSVSYPS